jgi:hypothetical protein
LLLGVQLLLCLLLGRRLCPAAGVPHWPAAGARPRGLRPALGEQRQRRRHPRGLFTFERRGDVGRGTGCRQ